MIRDCLTLAGVSKSYAGVPALEHLDLTLEAGRIHALVGENGAGKSTVVKIMAGGLAPDAGSMVLQGSDFRPRAPSEAQRMGVVAVQQELSLSPYQSVFQNIWLAQERQVGRIFGRNLRLREQTLALCRRYNVHVDVNAWVSDLTLEEQQVVEILKALARAPKLLILDEPTSALGASRTRWLLDLMKRLRDEGGTLLFISHRLPEVMEVADQITVLKDGQKVTTIAGHRTPESRVVQLMVGRDLQDIFPQKADPTMLEAAPIAFEAERLRSHWIRDVSFHIRQGEVVGLAGLAGQGQHELILSLFGLSPILGGTTKVRGKPIRAKSPNAAIRAGLCMVPVDRRTEGVILPLSVTENLSLPTLRDRQTAGWINRKQEREVVLRLIDLFSIRTSSLRTPLMSLSGGNQQKVAFSKWLGADPHVLILDDPTRGVDVEARRDIYHHIRHLASQGKGVLLNSTDLIELVGMCDRVLVMYEGAIVKNLTGSAISEEGIIAAAVGSTSGVHNG